MRIALIAVLLSVPLLAQNSDQASSPGDLPSAPSAVNQKKQAPPKPETGPSDTAPDSNSAQKASSAPDAAQVSEGSGTTTNSDVSSDAPSTRNDSTFVLNVNEVPVVFTVTDKHNHYVRDLSKNDFKVIDDGRPVPEIRSFRRETDLPLRVGLLIDSSASVRGRFKFEQEAAIEFMNQTIRPKYDQAFVLGFDSTLEVVQEFTGASELLSKGIRSLRPGNSTRLYDAIFYACRERLQNTSEPMSVRKAIVLITDGEDNSSRTTREEAIDMALRANVIVYTISTNFPGYAESGKYDKILQRIADATGGRWFEPFQVTDVANAFAQIQADLRSQYALAYRPEDFKHDGRYRTIEIMAEHKGLKVHSRHGYYAPAE
ncbi:MAG TPA: VWA domain-containing protein [Terriglobales bacterium]|jgi:VWFA-related protein|nr:VWA domain-containing protein [Terriglobales bacterium]